MSEWKKYRRTNTTEMRPWVEDDINRIADPLHGGISVSPEDLREFEDHNAVHGMIARNPDNHADQWYVARAYFEKNFEPYGMGGGG